MKQTVRKVEISTDHETKSTNGSPSKTNETSELSPRAKHLAWCKERAFEELDRGGPDAIHNAWASFTSDLTKSEETASVLRTVAMLGLPLYLMGHLNTPGEMRRHIEGYN